MMRKIICLALPLLFLCVVSGCSSSGKKVASFEQITPKEAKSIMDKESDCVILDVRTEEEFASGHIKDAILIPDYEIAAKAESIITDKEQLILVYCRSGRRSKLAAAELVNLGYTNVKEFGGIIDWPYETV